MIPQIARAAVQTRVIAVIEGASAAELATNVATQMNTLNKALTSPALNQTAGVVINGTITVSDARTSVVNNVASYYCTVSWQAMVTPV